MRSDKYILEGQTPVPCNDLQEWAMWFEKANRNVAKTEIGKYSVSTVFLSMDHAFDGGRPLLFETMIFGAEDGEELDGYQTRCSTWGMAEQQHEEAVTKVKQALNLTP